MELRYHISVEHNSLLGEPTLTERGFGSLLYTSDREQEIRSLAKRMAKERPGQNLRLIPYVGDTTATRLRQF
ncbi:hypothetical protein HN747_00510 [archaeon]|jgi:hypothetical protein|nr:hypothetical protein [archaeon]